MEQHLLITVQISILKANKTYGGYSTSVVVDEKFVLHSKKVGGCAIVRRSYHGLHYVIGTEIGFELLVVKLLVGAACRGNCKVLNVLMKF
jgi:hypothetical protein